jgi:hypothetical protein
MKVTATLLGATATSMAEDMAFKRILSWRWGGDWVVKAVGSGSGWRGLPTSRHCRRWSSTTAEFWIYTHVLKLGGSAVRSPLDTMSLT